MSLTTTRKSSTSKTKTTSEDQIQAARGLIDQLDAGLTRLEKYDLPFGFGVFGTLRILPEGQGNSRLMTQKPYEWHSKAFLPHFSPSGIHLDFKKGASGIFEVFFYTPEVWQQIIRNIDGLEGFYPASSSGRGDWGYYRTLMRMRLLPDNAYTELFDRGIRYNDRDLGIPESEWENYPWVPVWVYSSKTENRRCEAEAGETSPVLWYD